ncbi:MAG: 50S ribosomal protein L14e [Candidatus Woesearchaeota archaeon]
MFEVGRVCIKLAGRDAGKRCIILDILDKNMALIDGETRRRKCNVAHLEPLPEVLKIEKNASHNEVVKLFKEFGIELRETKKKQPGQKPK